MANNTVINFLKPHLAINVKDVEASIEFYKKMFGIEPSKVRTGYAKFDVQSPQLNFTLNQVPFNERGALSHLGIQVASTDDVLALRHIWEERGLIPRDEMQTSCCYALQDKAWVNDPDGNEWEVFTVIEDNLPETNSRVGGDVMCCAPASVDAQTRKETQGSACGCESALPAEGEGACCETQAAKFGIDVKPDATAASCCGAQPIGA
jgi:catechol 2,3-dioxygenase-like lactoylglutathione lyase family enzyme